MPKPRDPAPPKPDIDVTTEALVKLSRAAVVKILREWVLLDQSGAVPRPDCGLDEIAVVFDSGSLDDMLDAVELRYQPKQ